MSNKPSVDVAQLQSPSPGSSLGLESFTETAAVVIDNGTGYTKAGFAGDPKPGVVLPTVVGLPTSRKCSSPDYYAGDEVLNRRGVRRCEPVTRGVVTDWEAMEMLWHHVFYGELRASPDEHAVLLADGPLAPGAQREKAAEVLFEGFRVPAMYVVPQPVLSLYSTGRTSGLVIEAGFGASYVAPVVEGYTLPHATQQIDVAGAALTEYLAKLLAECGNAFSPEERPLVRDIKERCCYVAQDYAEEMLAPETDYLTDYRLPDGHLINIGNERFRCPEAFFQPDALGLTDAGLHQLAARSLELCQAKHRPELLGNLVLSGGSSLFPGLAERLKWELDRLLAEPGAAAGAVRLGVFASSHRRFSVWIGGSITACLNSFQSMWVRRADYDEEGPSVVLRKCY
ncbi:actin, clone 302-like [Mobula hypostoma]|uniref:actin, clone 302-like n=1 Tax=Mobula hypostoma TaxID=723540 RepID=UPI002FC32148